MTVELLSNTRKKLPITILIDHKTLPITLPITNDCRTTADQLPICPEKLPITLPNAPKKLCAALPRTPGVQHSAAALALVGSPHWLHWPDRRHRISRITNHGMRP